VPREGAVLLAGNHTRYGLIDIPMLRGDEAPQGRALLAGVEFEIFVDAADLPCAPTSSMESRY